MDSSMYWEAVRPPFHSGVVEAQRESSSEGSGWVKHRVGEEAGGSAMLDGSEAEMDGGFTCLRIRLLFLHSRLKPES
jgi:hypothetical protein